MNVLYAIKEFNDWYAKLFLTKHIENNSDINDHDIASIINTRDDTLMAICVGYMWTLILEEEVTYYFNGKHAYIGVGDVLYDATSIMLTGHPRDHKDTYGFTTMEKVEAFDAEQFHDRFIKPDFIKYCLVDAFIKEKVSTAKYEFDFEGEVDLAKRQYVNSILSK